MRGGISARAAWHRRNVTGITRQRLGAYGLFSVASQLVALRRSLRSAPRRVSRAAASAKKNENLHKAREEKA